MAAGAPTVSTETLMARFGARLRRLRTAKRISQQELARRTGTDRGDIIDYEKGRVWPRAKSLVRLLNALEATDDDLFRGAEGERRAPLRTSDASASIAEPGRMHSEAAEITDPLRDDWEAEVMQIRIKDLAIEIPIDRLTMSRSTAPGGRNER